MSKHDQVAKYASLLISKITELFDEDNESGLNISLEELERDENTTHFFHALLNVAPTYIFNKFTSDDKKTLEVNHVANVLVFQYADKDGEETTEELIKS